MFFTNKLRSLWFYSYQKCEVERDVHISLVIHLWIFWKIVGFHFPGTFRNHFSKIRAVAMSKFESPNTSGNPNRRYAKRPWYLTENGHFVVAHSTKDGEKTLKLIGRVTASFASVRSVPSAKAVNDTTQSFTLCVNDYWWQLTRFNCISVLPPSFVKPDFGLPEDNKWNEACVDAEKTKESLKSECVERVVSSSR